MFPTRLSGSPHRISCSMAMKMRKDKVTDGGIADAIMTNAPAREDHFFLVPKVVE